MAVGMQQSTMRISLLIRAGLLTLAMAPTPLAAPAPAIARLDGSQISRDRVDTIVTEAMKAAHVTGAGVTIFNAGQPVYMKTYGVCDAARNLPFTSDSVVTAASLTKTAFAVMVMQLVQDGIIDLDKPVFRYLPRPLPEYPPYRDLAADPRYRQITMRMLLDHTSGFPNWRRFTDDRKLRIYFPPGSRFAYSGEGIALAQMVVETVTGKSVDALMHARLFGPLGMTQTSMVWEPRFEHNLCNGYNEQGRSLGPERRRKGDAAGSMQTTLRDYSRFVSAILSGKLLDARMRALMFRPQIRIETAHEFPSLSTDTTTENNDIRLSYGLGWGLYFSPFGEAFFKEGHDEGWRHYVVCFEKLRSGVLIMTNSSNGEDIYSTILEETFADTYTPLEWEGFKPREKLPQTPALRKP